MSYELLMSYIQHFGYAALFFSLWLGIVGMPIPDEVIVMTGGAVTTSGLLHPLPTFLLTYLGVISGLTLGYVLGRLAGVSVLNKFRHKRGMNKYLKFSETLIQKYGSFALGISYFFPVIRHVMPYVVGASRMTFRRYALFSYTSGFVWTLLFFLTGRIAGENAWTLGMFLYTNSFYLLLVLFILVSIWIIFRFASKSISSRRNRHDDPHSRNR